MFLALDFFFCDNKKNLLKRIEGELENYRINPTSESALVRLGKQEGKGFCTFWGYPAAEAMWKHNVRETDICAA